MRNVQFVSQPSGNLYNRHTGSLIFREAKRLRKILSRIYHHIRGIRDSRASKIRSLGNFEARVKSDLIRTEEARFDFQSGGEETRFPACSKHQLSGCKCGGLARAFLARGLETVRSGLIEKLLPLKRRAVPLLSNRTRRSTDTRELETFHGAMTLSWPRRRGYALRAIRRFSPLCYE